MQRNSNTNFIFLSTTCLGLEPTINCTRSEYAYHYTTNGVLNSIIFKSISNNIKMDNIPKRISNTRHQSYIDVKLYISTLSNLALHIGVLTVNIELMWRGLETGERRALVPSHINSIFTVNTPILYLSWNKICIKKTMLFNLIIKKKITETPLIPQ